MVFVFLYRFYWCLLLFLLPIISGMGMTIHKDRLIDMPVSNHGARVRLILQRYTLNKYYRSPIYHIVLFMCLLYSKVI